MFNRPPLIFNNYSMQSQTTVTARQSLTFTAGAFFSSPGLVAASFVSLSPPAPERTGVFPVIGLPSFFSAVPPVFLP